MVALSATQVKNLIRQTHAALERLDHEQWDPKTSRYGVTSTEIWVMAPCLVPISAALWIGLR
jgi:hypothetical protein